MSRKRWCGDPVYEPDPTQAFQSRLDQSAVTTPVAVQSTFGQSIVHENRIPLSPTGTGATVAWTSFL
jgi:hypothetical protein